jgi:hypothetical protein
MFFYVIKVLNSNIGLLRYDVLNKTKYKNYVDLIDLISSEPTEHFEITNCPSINNNYIPAIKPNVNNKNSSNVLIITTTLVSFIIIIGFILCYFKKVRNKKEKEIPIFIYDDNFGTEFDEIVTQWF